MGPCGVTIGRIFAPPTLITESRRITRAGGSFLFAFSGAITKRASWNR